MNTLTAYLTFAIMLISHTTLSQYYYFPNTTPSKNPGGLNTDLEYPTSSLTSGWTSVLSGGNASGTYSSAKTIPFSFNFNGSAVTQYKVSNSGILTFDVGTATSPGPSNTSLPSASVPDKSICIWGLSGSGNNDNIVTKTFGSSPDRQHWIFFTSYNYSGGGASCWTYWSIVLEEGTDKVFLVDQKSSSSSSCAPSLTLGIQIDNSTAFQVSGSPNISPLAGTSAGPSDNAYYEFVYGVQYSYDFTIVDISTPSFPNITDAPYEIHGNLRNRGTENITSFDINYSVDGGSTITDNINSVNISSESYYDFELDTDWNPSVTGSYDIDVWASNLNGNADQYTLNDLLEKTITVSDPIPNILSNYLGGFTDTLISTSSDGLDDPKDLDFHPDLSRLELWVINHETETSGGTTVTYSNAGKTAQTSSFKQDGNAYHFMSLPTGIAFSDNGNFGTSTGVYDANHDGGNPFTGPSLWSSDPAVYAQTSGGNGSHLDMLHESPYSMGIAHETGNVFWVFDANSKDIVRYDFGGDHGPGNSDHADGKIRRFPVPVNWINDEIPCHLVLDKNTGWLYIADNGNQRILRLDINSGSTAGMPSFGPYESLAEYKEMTGITYENYINSGLLEPSGIDIIHDRLIVSDHSNGDIILYDVSGASPNELGKIQTGSAGIMGIKIGPKGNIWYVNGQNNEVHKLTPNSLSIKETTLNNLSIYPNPSDGTFILEGHTLSGHQISITDLLGQKVLEDHIINGTKKTYDLSIFNPGVYFLNI